MPYFGRNIRTAVFGQSHAAAIGVTIDGLPAGEAVDAVELEAFMARRAPEQNRMTTQRREADRPEILCGIVDGRTCGAPLTSIIRNGDTRSKDYAAIADLPRPSHADWPAHVRYGGWQDVRGGGASLTGCAVLRDLGAASVTTISRSGLDNYGNLDRHADAQLIVNTTPVGMHPTCDASPLETLEAFPALESVLDIIYNPACTELMLLARSRSLPTENGLSMLVMQAQAAAERFLGHALPDAAAEDILKDMTLQFSNLVLLGMPGSGKTKVARRLAELLHRPFVDVDELIVRKAGRSIPDIFARDGEAHFRDLESKVIEGFSAGHCLVVATGGGSVLRERNCRLLQRNGLVLWLHRPLEELPSAGRPVSLARGVEAIFVEREPIFRALAHRIITSRRLRTQFSRSSEKSRETSDHQRPQHQFSGHSRTGHLRQHNLQGPVRNTRDLVRRCRRLMRAFPVQP